MPKVAIVTGSNRGIGFGVVKFLSKCFDGDVCLTSRNEKKGLAAVNKLREEGIHAKYHQLDITDDDSITNMAKFIKEDYGGLDILVNNAGIECPDSTPENIGRHAAETVQTNYFGTRMVCDHFFPMLRSGARVVNVSSSSGFLPKKIPSEFLRRKFASSDSTLTIDELDTLMYDYIESAKAGTHIQKGWNTPYRVSKVGVSALSRIQQREMDKDPFRSDIAINHTHPGHVNTDMCVGAGGPLTIEQGAGSSVFAATLPQGTDVRGMFIWADCEVVDWVNGPRPPSIIGNLVGLNEGDYASDSDTEEEL